MTTGSLLLAAPPGPRGTGPSGSPARLAAAWAQVQRHGVLLDTTLKEPDPIALADLERVHQRRHIQAVEAIAADGGGWVDGDTFVAAASYDAALRAAGAAVEACAAVLGGQQENAFALVRPPGHHAPADRAMGFCLFNNVAVGAAWALAAGGAQRVLIVDFDVHHGNGTQDIFYDRSDVCFFSVHQYPLYPGTGALAETGRVAATAAPRTCRCRQAATTRSTSAPSTRCWPRSRGVVDRI